jgi:hypothetical protein
MVNGYRVSGCGWLLSLLALMPTMAGCGKASDDPAEPAAPEAAAAGNLRTVDEFAQRFGARYCQSIADCCSSRGFATNDCATTLETQLRALLQASATNPKIRFNPDGAAACINAYAAALSACTDHASFLQIDSACDRVLEGTIAVGGECGTSAECARPASGSVGCTSGVCVLGQSPVGLNDAPHRKLGEACAATCEGVPREQSCSGTSGADPTLGACWVDEGLVCSNGACVHAPKAGEACVSFGYCEGAAHCVNSVCAADLSDGPCQQDRECLAPAICDYTRKVCTPLKANGEPCEASNECQGGQCYQDRCRTWSVAEPGACRGILDD